MAINRRHFVGLSGAAAASFFIGRHVARAAGGTPFTLGVASGEPTPDGFVLWTRLAREPLAPDGLGGMIEPVNVTWEVAADERMRSVILRGSVEADSRLAHSVHVDAGGLQPDRPYWYRFTALGEQSPIGRTRTAPAPNAQLDRLRFAFASCSNRQVGYFSAYRHIAEENPDLVLFLGDYIYEFSYARGSNRILRPHDGPGAIDLTGYRNRYALYHTDPDLQALHASAPCLATWDDHEVQNDYADAWSQVVDTSPEAFLRRRAAAYRAFYEHMPVRAVRSGSAMRLYGRHRYGTLAMFCVLDGRQYRTVQPCPTPRSRRGHVAPASCDDLLDPRRSYLGLEQEAWLFDGFKQADTAWTILAQEQLVAQLREHTRDGGIGFWTEGWDGFPLARRRMLEAIAATRVPNPVFVGGDSHSFWVTDLKADFDDDASPVVASEFVGTSVTSDPPPYKKFKGFLPENPHVKYFEARERGYVSVELTRTRMDVRLRKISDRRNPKATVSTLKSFVVETGKPGAIPA